MDFTFSTMPDFKTNANRLFLRLLAVSTLCQLYGWFEDDSGEEEGRFLTGVRGRKISGME